MVATGAAKNITEAMKTLTKSENSMSTTLAAVLAKGQRLDDKLVGVAYREETGKIPTGSVKLSEVNEWKEDNKGKTLISEGIDANYYDMINYALFALIKISEIENS